MIIPKCLPGQIMIRGDDDEWHCIWPKHGMTHDQKWFFGIVTIGSVALIMTALALVLMFT